MFTYWFLSTCASRMLMRPYNPMHPMYWMPYR